MYIKDEVSSTLIIEKSRFIAYIKPVFNEDEYKEYLKEIRKKYYDASHVVSAFISNNIKRSSDDGEPSGTGGIPVLNILGKTASPRVRALLARRLGAQRESVKNCLSHYGIDQLEIGTDRDCVKDLRGFFEKRRGRKHA